MTFNEMVDRIHSTSDIKTKVSIKKQYEEECKELKTRVFDYIKKGLNNRSDYGVYCLECWRDAAREYPEDYGPDNDLKAYQRWRNNATETLVKEFLAILHKEDKFMDFLEGIRFNEFNPEDKTIDFRFCEGHGLWVTNKVEIIVK